METVTILKKIDGLKRKAVFKTVNNSEQEIELNKNKKTRRVTINKSQFTIK